MNDAVPAIEPPDWNVLVTTREGEQRAVRRALSRLVRLRRSGYRNVLIGRVIDAAALLDGVAELLERGLLQEQLGRVIPIERTFAVDAAAFDVQLREEAAAFLPRLAHRRFHVRIDRRGHKGLIRTVDSEQALGDHLGSQLERAGQYAGVDFRDPDVVLVVQLIGDQAGIALVTRELRERYPFVHVD